MKSAFADVRLEWDGRSYKIPGDRVMRAIARVERIVTPDEIRRMVAERNAIPLATVALAYAELLAFAGAEGVTDEHVYAGMFGAQIDPELHARHDDLVKAIADKAAELTGADHPAEARAELQAAVDALAGDLKAAKDQIEAATQAAAEAAQAAASTALGALFDLMQPPASLLKRQAVAAAASGAKK